MKYLLYVVLATPVLSESLPIGVKAELPPGTAFTTSNIVNLTAFDEVRYVLLAEVGAEFLFQVIAERAEKGPVILPTNLPVRAGHGHWSIVSEHAVTGRIENVS
jgi:hypothetical protein